MVHIMSVSHLRAHLAHVLKEVNTSNQPIVVVQDSNPVATIHPYIKSPKATYADGLLEMDTSWFNKNTEKDMLHIRKEVEKRTAQHK